MKKGLLMVLVLALLVLATTANAQVFGKGKGQFSFGLTHFTAFASDTLLFFSTVHNDQPEDMLRSSDLVGFGGEFRYGFSERWALALGGYYGFGSEKLDGSTFGEFKFKYSAFGLRLGLDHTVNLTDMLGFYMGPGFEFGSAKSGVEISPGGFSEDNDRTTSLSLDGRMGVVAKLGERFGLNGSMGKKWSMVSSKFDTEFFSGAPAEEVKVSGWTSSVNGWAGFVVLF